MPRTRRCSPEMPNITWIYRAGSGVSTLLAILLASHAWCDEVKPRGANVYQMVTGDDSEEDRRHWDTFYNTRKYIFGKEPAAFIQENISKIQVGRALDIAMGEGRNAVYLAKKGFRVDGVDISEVALRKAKRLARENRVTVNTINADLGSYIIKPESYDVILNIDYLQRALIPQIKRGLRHGGMVVYEAYTLDQLDNTRGERIRRDYLLSKGELKELFRDFKVVVYEETNDGVSAKARLIAQKQ
jgi:tellurite methyltransferase